MKHSIAVFMAATLILCSGCSAKFIQKTNPANTNLAASATTDNQETNPTNTDLAASATTDSQETNPTNADPAASAAADSQETKEEQKTLTGSLDEIKDFMFIVTDDNGDSYALSFGENKPNGLEKCSAGDRITVTYTGKLSVVDAFTGEILSVEPAK